jgi:hypothetical protein
MFVEEKSVVIGLAILVPEVEKDKWNNVISEIKFPGRTYRMVHHPSKNHFRSSATIYGGKDKFVRFSSYSSDRDTEENSATLMTNVGDFYVAWGDGDLLWFDVPDQISADAERIKDMRKLLSDGKWVESEEAFTLLCMQLIEDSGVEELWMNKAQWEAKKIVLQKERLIRRAKGGY